MPRSRHPLERAAIRILGIAEQIVFFVIGLSLFAAALALLVRTLPLLAGILGSGPLSPIEIGTDFLDLVLLVLMVVELAYTVMLSLRGAVLSAEPFLIVGLIAVIRRILVITVGEFKNGAATGSIASQGIELAILTGVVLAFVVSIALLRTRRRSDAIPDHDDL